MYARTRQIQARNEDATEAALRLRRLCENGQEVFNNEQQLRLRPLERGNLVLAFRFVSPLMMFPLTPHVLLFPEIFLLSPKRRKTTFSDKEFVFILSKLQ